MASWKEPETNHTAGDQVTPEIFNTLAENEVYLNETKITTTGAGGNGYERNKRNTGEFDGTGHRDGRIR